MEFCITGGNISYHIIARLFTAMRSIKLFNIIFIKEDACCCTKRDPVLLYVDLLFVCVIFKCNTGNRKTDRVFVFHRIPLKTSSKPAMYHYYLMPACFCQFGAILPRIMNYTGFLEFQQVLVFGVNCAIILPYP